MNHSIPSVTCPMCTQKVLWSSQSLYRPFCSERCKLIDLGDWASEKHVVSEPALVDPQDPLQD